MRIFSEAISQQCPQASVDAAATLQSVTGWSRGSISSHTLVFSCRCRKTSFNSLRSSVHVPASVGTSGGGSGAWALSGLAASGGLANRIVGLRVLYVAERLLSTLHVALFRSLHSRRGTTRCCSCSFCIISASLNLSSPPLASGGIVYSTSAWIRSGTIEDTMVPVSNLG